MRTNLLTLFLLLTLSTLIAKADNDLTITNENEQSITTNGTYLLKGTESQTITLNNGITVTIKLENDVIVSGDIIVPGNSSLTIEGANHKLTVSGNIGGKDGKSGTSFGGHDGSVGEAGESGKNSGTIIINSTSIQSKNIGGGNGGNGATNYESFGFYTGGNGGNGGNSNAISISNSILNITQAGGGQAGNGGYVRQNKGGSGGNGGNCTGNITITNSTINAVKNIGAGKKGLKGGAGSTIGSGWHGNDGTDGNMQNESTIVPTNSLLKIGNETSIIGTYTFSEDLIVDNLEIKPSSNITISEGKQVYVNTKLKADNTVSVNGNIVLGSRVTIDGNFTNFSYAINILFKKDNSNWNDVDKTIILKYNSTNKDASWTKDNNKYSAICKFDDSETYNIFIGDLDTKQSISKSAREITLNYYSLNFSTNGGSGSVPIQYLLNDAEHPTEPTTSLTKQYYTFDGWSSSYSSSNKVDFNSATINRATTYYAMWKPNTFEVNTATKQELTYKQAMTGYDLSKLLKDNAVDNCGEMTYKVSSSSSLPNGLSLDTNTGIISGTPNAATTEDVTVTVTATAENTSSQNIDVTFSIAKVNTEINNISTGTYSYTGSAIAIDVPTLKGANPDNLTPSLKYYTSYTNKSANIPTNAENSGASGEGEAPVYTGNYIVVASFAGNDNYKKATDKTANFTINQVELTVTPKSDQVVYEDDKILYTVTGIPEGGDEPTFEGALKVDESGNVIEDEGFKLSNESAKNYSYTFTSGIPATICSGKAEDAEAVTQATEGLNSWSTTNITIIPPTGFQIALASSTLKSTLEYADKLVWTTEGKHTIKYSLKRNNNDITYEHEVSVNLDKTAPVLSHTYEKLNYTLTFSDGVSGINELFVDGNKVTLAPGATTYTATGAVGTHTAKVTDKAGLEKEISFTLEDDDPDVPPYYPEPEPVYYDVTLPETAGVTFSPTAGTYSVEEYGSFSFSLTVAEGYREQSVPVVKVNGNVYDPVDADGRYKIKFIRSDQSVTVEGILADNPTANENLSTPVFKLRTEGHTLCITVAQPRLCRLFDPSGRLICSRQLTLGINRLEGLAAGIYFVVVEREGVRKIVVQ
ncbi:putative Ig domain-containing protein [Parabacteroides gordonii]|uniref:putative Ig domain-containing protein n=1 Tax=Parabacteroides gordonii TaxID=574930 RepID=UPI0026EC11D4|nr:putative Ig domain-containing protein [Parabacteroides gordonii]